MPALGTSGVFYVQLFLLAQGCRTLESVGRIKGALPVAVLHMGAREHCPGTVGRDVRPLAPLHPLHGSELKSRRSIPKEDSGGDGHGLQTMVCWRGSGAEPAELTCCGGHTSHSGGPGSPGTAHSSRTARSFPPAPESPVGNRQGVKGDGPCVSPLCPCLDPTRDGTCSGPRLPPIREEAAAGSRLSPHHRPLLSQEAHLQATFPPQGGFYPNQAPSTITSLRGCRSRLCRLSPAPARHPTAAAALLWKGYQSFINCSSRFD